MHDFAAIRKIPTHKYPIDWKTTLLKKSVFCMQLTLELSWEPMLKKLAEILQEIEERRDILRQGHAKSHAEACEHLNEA